MNSIAAVIAAAFSLLALLGALWTDFVGPAWYSRADRRHEERQRGLGKENNAR